MKACAICYYEPYEHMARALGLTAVDSLERSDISRRQVVAPADKTHGRACSEISIAAAPSAAAPDYLYQPSFTPLGNPCRSSVENTRSPKANLVVSLLASPPSLFFAAVLASRNEIAKQPAASTSSAQAGI